MNTVNCVCLDWSIFCPAAIQIYRSVSCLVFYVVVIFKVLQAGTVTTMILQGFIAFTWAPKWAGFVVCIPAIVYYRCRTSPVFLNDDDVWGIFDWENIALRLAICAFCFIGSVLAELVAPYVQLLGGLHNAAARYVLFDSITLYFHPDAADDLLPSILYHLLCAWAPLWFVYSTLMLAHCGVGISLCVIAVHV